MTVHIVARHVKLTKALKDFVQERMEKIQHYFDHIVWAQVILSVDKKTQEAEIVLHAARQTFKSSNQNADMYAAIDAAAAKIEAQVKKYKEKMKDHRGESIVMRAAEPSISVSDVRFSVVKQVPVLPMSPDDAAFEMERLGYTFWMFLDEETKQINLIFKRQDNSFGLIQPIKKA